MARTVEEWISASDDSAIPPRVRVRVFERAGGRCEECTRKISPGDAWQADHVVALINGGANRESNLRCVCSWCHAAKTAGDVAEKAKTAAARKRHLGIRPPSRMAGARNSGIKIKLNGQVVDRATGEPAGGKGR